MIKFIKGRIGEKDPYGNNKPEIELKIYMRRKTKILSENILIVSGQSNHKDLFEYIKDSIFELIKSLYAVILIPVAIVCFMIDLLPTFVIYKGDKGDLEKVKKITDEHKLRVSPIIEGLKVKEGRRDNETTRD